MTPPATKPCEQCSGAGVIPRLQRRLADGSLDKADIVGATKGLCERCGGSGQELVNPSAPNAARSGFAADIWA